MGANDDSGGEKVHSDEDHRGPDGRYKLSGHGNYYAENSTIRVPEGTTITVYAEHGSPISQALGNLIESGGDLSRVYSKTYYAGDEIPNYTLEPPDGLNVVGNPRTVDRPTLLSELLRPHMSNVDFAACLGYSNPKRFDVSGIYHRDTDEPLELYPNYIIDDGDDNEW